MSELHQHWPNPEQALIRKQVKKGGADGEDDVDAANVPAAEQLERDASGDSFTEGEYARHVAGEDYEVEKPEEGFVTDDPAHNDPIGGVLGSRRMGRYAEEAKYPNRKWKRGDKHRGIEKPAKYRRQGGTPRSV